MLPYLSALENAFAFTYIREAEVHPRLWEVGLFLFELGNQLVQRVGLADSWGH